MLLIAGGLTLKSLIGLEGRNLGFSSDHVLRARSNFRNRSGRECWLRRSRV